MKIESIVPGNKTNIDFGWMSLTIDKYGEINHWFNNDSSQRIYGKSIRNVHKPVDTGFDKFIDIAERMYIFLDEPDGVFAYATNEHIKDLKLYQRNPSKFKKFRKMKQLGL